MAIYFKETESSVSRSRSGLGKNSTAVQNGDFVTIAGNVVAAATGADVLAGFSNGTKTMTATNQTVAKEQISYTVADESQAVRVDISGGTVTAADVNKFFGLADARTVNGASVSATAGALKLVNFVSATLGDFVFAGK